MKFEQMGIDSEAEELRRLSFLHVHVTKKVYTIVTRTYSFEFT